MSLTDASQAAVGAAITVLILAIALVAPLVYVAFYATNYTFFQKVVVVLVSLILAVAPGAGMWVLWGGGRGLMRSLAHTLQPREGGEGGGSFLSLLCFNVWV